VIAGCEAREVDIADTIQDTAPSGGKAVTQERIVVVAVAVIELVEEEMKVPAALYQNRRTAAPAPLTHAEAVTRLPGSTGVRVEPKYMVTEGSEFSKDLAEYTPWPRYCGPAKEITEAIFAEGPQDDTSGVKRLASGASTDTNQNGPGPQAPVAN